VIFPNAKNQIVVAICCGSIGKVPPLVFPIYSRVTSSFFLNYWTFYLAGANVSSFFNIFSISGRIYRNINKRKNTVGIVHNKDKIVSQSEMLTENTFISLGNIPRHVIPMLIILRL
jgi:hypothetical protein